MAIPTMMDSSANVTIIRSHGSTDVAVDQQLSQVLVSHFVAHFQIGPVEELQEIVHLGFGKALSLLCEVVSQLVYGYQLLVLVLAKELQRLQQLLLRFGVRWAPGDQGQEV